MKNIFEIATRQRYRFATSRGLVTTEDLWDLSLEVLDGIAQELDKKIKQSADTKSFIRKTKAADEVAANMLEVIVSIIGTKMAEAEARAKATERKVKRQKILGLMAEKQDKVLSAKSLSSLQKELDALDEDVEEEVMA